MGEPRRKGWSSLASYGFIVVGVILPTYFFLVLYARGCSPGTGKPLVRLRTCEANMRVLEGGFEQYLQAGGVGIPPTNLPEGLGEKGYLKGPVACPGEFVHSSFQRGTYAWDGGQFVCSVHGTPEEIRQKEEEERSLLGILRRGWRHFDLSALLFIPVF